MCAIYTNKLTNLQLFFNIYSKLFVCIKLQQHPDTLPDTNNQNHCECGFDARAGMDNSLLKPDTVLEILKLYFIKDQKTRVSSDAVKLTTDMIHLFILEAAHRTATQAQNEQVGETDIHHFEKILPKLLLDF